MKPGFLIGLLAAICLAGCTRNEFNLELELSDSGTSDFRVVYYASDPRQGFYVETNVVADRGHGALRGMTRYPTLVYLFGRGGGDPLVIYAERGDKITLSGDSHNPSTWSVTGNDINDEWTRWRTDNSSALLSSRSDSINAAVARYVEANPDNEVALLLMLTTFRRHADEALYRRLWQSLPLSLRDSGITRLAGRSDQPDARLPQPMRLGSLVIRGRYGLDTLRCADTDATLICFWANDRSPLRTEMIDSLRSLTAQYPDSAARHIADISLDPDSMTWIAPLLRDSLKGSIRGWIPLGVTDPSLMALGVRRVPSMMVFDRRGDIIYRGDSIGAAFSAFRSLIPPSADKQ